MLATKLLPRYPYFFPLRRRYPPSHIPLCRHSKPRCLQGEEEDALLVPTGPSQRVQAIEGLSDRIKKLSALLDSTLEREADARLGRRMSLPVQLDRSRHLSVGADVNIGDRPLNRHWGRLCHVF